MQNTCHSDYGRLQSVYIKKFEDAALHEKNIGEQWQKLNFLSKPDFENGKKEYNQFENLLKKSGASIFYFGQDPHVTLDSLYCRDASIATDGGMILCSMGKEARVPEPGAQRKIFEKNGVELLGEIVLPGTVEGGDVAWLDPHTLVVGHTYRTNTEGIKQLGLLLKKIGVEIIVTSLPHYKGPSDVFHLMSIFSPVDKDLAVVYSPLMPISFRQELQRRGYRFVEVPDAEFESMGCNVLAIAPRVCIMVEGNPQTRDALLKQGCEVNEYSGNEISVKGGGGPTCLTRPILRTI